MKLFSLLRWPGLLCLALTAHAANNQILGWNNLGMHCMDSDYSVFSILPPYNTIEAQLIVNGHLVTNGSAYTVTYQAVADPSGSFNSTAAGKGNFYEFALPLFGANPPVDSGLLTWGLPGTNNVPQGMLFERTNEPVPGVFTPVNWWRAEGIPLSPYDDSHVKNPYPLMLLVARDGANNILATNQIVLPISDEMDCRACHSSGSGDAAKPAAGWVWDGIQERDFRLNILRLHDEHEFANHSALYQAALAGKGFNPQGLYRNVIADGKPVLCAACHSDVALLADGYSGVPPFTRSMHDYHAHVMDPLLNVTLDNVANRSACYRCHPGSTTKCLRGAMGGAIAADGSMEMQCQSCHGNMSAVGSINHLGWLTEPNCASCHTGTATTNNGLIRYTSAFTNGVARIAVNPLFSTQPNVPAPGLSLFRFSIGHGGLQCEACHGSTHAEFPSTHANDNLRDLQIQGYAGVMVECTSCHVAMQNSSATAVGGPHGMHPVGQDWVSGHHDYIGSIPGGVASCQACHGMDFRGTVLSRALGSRTLTADFDGTIVTLDLYRGALIGCYNCHNGPGNDDIHNSTPPTVNVVSGDTPNDTPLHLPVTVTPTTATLRIISQPVNGSLGVSSNVLTYFPDPGFAGSDAFTYAAWDGSKNSLLATGTVAVTQGPYSLGVVVHVPTNYPAGWPVAFAAVPAVTNYSGPVTFSWNFGDGSPANTNQFPGHTYMTSGDYNWSVTATASNATATATGSIAISATTSLAITPVQNSSSLTLTWPQVLGGIVVEQSDSLGADAKWTVTTNLQFTASGAIIPVTDSNRFFRLRQSW